MDYKKIYQKLIDSRRQLNRTRHDGNNYDLHHILPRSLGGTDEDNNLILLTYKEHFVAHELLAKIYPGKAMKSALFIMMNSLAWKDKNNGLFSAKKYEKAKTEYIDLIKKKTVCLETGYVYNSREEANLAAGLAKFSADIVHAFNSNKTAGGYHWAPFEEGVDYTKNPWFGKEKEEKFLLIRLEDLKRYKSWKEAANDIKATVGALGYSMKTIGGTAKGYHFSKYEEGVDYTKNPWFGKEPQKNLGLKQKVVCLETGEIFEKVSDLTKSKGYNVIDYQKKHNGLAKDGYHYIKEIQPVKQSERITLRKSRIKKIQCIETGEIFSSQADALRKLGISSSGGICVAIKLNRKCAGYHWRYVDENFENRESNN